MLILHLDMDAFFAAIERLRRPELAGRPVVIGGHGDPRERGVVSTASYEAREYGIHSGMPLRTALRLCPQAVFLPVDFHEYLRVSAAIKGILRRVSPVMEDAGIDECYLDIGGLDVPPAELAAQIKRGVREATGLSCSIGIGPNKLLAKLASDLEKPDGLTVLGAGDLERRIWPLPVRKLPGVGPKTEVRLHQMGVRSVGELAAQPAQLLENEFGHAHGRWLHDAAHGVDERPLVTRWQPKSMSHELTFQQDVGDLGLLASTLARLARAVAADLRRGGYRGRNVTVKLRYADFETHTRDRTLGEPTDDPEALERTALGCLARFAIGKKVRLVGVRVGGLRRAPRKRAPGKRAPRRVRAVPL